jgi:hypothetical protein
MYNFSEEDVQYLAAKGIEPRQAHQQIETFREGIPPVRLARAAVVGDGIVRLPGEEQERLRRVYRQHRKRGLQVVKFIPASGAASRMFKALFAFLNDFDPEADSLQAYLSQPQNKDVRVFAEGLERFPFYGAVRSRMGETDLSTGAGLYGFVREMLSEAGLNYGFYPKGLLPFHNYGGHLATPFEEHLKEGAAYGRTGDTAKLHFTISPQHRELFGEEARRVVGPVGERTSCRFDISYSFQKESTDTLAVTPENEPFRDGEGKLLFRPGGHGALLENLNEQEADLLFIKNIDNVVTGGSLSEISDWKEILGGHLLEVQEQAFRFSRMLGEGLADHDLIQRIRAFLETALNVRFQEGFSGLSLEEQLLVLQDKLSRPIRVCGMVKNEGEPGGGPFWIADAQGRVSLQIVESAQVDLGEESQKALFDTATHFNPVDLVCGVRDALGRKFDLMNYRDPKQGFITGKTFEGRPLKALELPGLWNGGMAYWNTVFVEVPVSTFNPVKTVNDLLKPAHQAGRGE